MNLVDKMPQHGFGNLEIRYDAIAHRSNGNDVARGFSQHVLCFKSNSQNPVFGSVIGSYRHHRGLAEYYALAFHINQGIGGSQIYG